MKGEKCKTCKYHKPLYMHYPCRDCDGKSQPPVTCECCRYYPCFKSKRSLKPCDNFEWD